MTQDFKKIGLKAGLEIHQQLNTKKLFCNCPSILRSDEPIKKITRKLNPVVGETGEIDKAALHEKEKDLEFTYLMYDTNCLVELDEEPPHEINKEALHIALQIAHLLDCNIFPVSQVMRKTVIDGSNTSGFQRTVQIAYDGKIETSKGPVRIASVALEEDSARKVIEENGKKVYSLDRLGIPLVEITTYPDLTTPEHIKEAALKIGEILRACNVRRGIGTIRQDLNISIKGSKRVEIKGFQDPKIMEQTVLEEIKRQEICVKEKKCESQVRKALPNGKTEFLRPMPGSARMYPETDVPLLKISREIHDTAKKNLPKLSSEHKSYLKEFGLNEELVKLLLKKNKVEDFKTLQHEHNNPSLIAKMLTLFQPEKEVGLDQLETILEHISKGTVGENDTKTVMQKISQGKTIKEALQKSEVNLDEEVKKLLKEKPGLTEGAYMGLVMGKFKGQVSGKEVADALKKALK